jgi:hypothetical protein
MWRSESGVYPVTSVKFGENTDDNALSKLPRNTYITSFVILKESVGPGNNLRTLDGSVPNSERSH